MGSINPYANTYSEYSMEGGYKDGGQDPKKVLVGSLGARFISNYTQCV